MISSEQLIDRAVADTGLEDFGSPTFRDGLDRLTAALTDEAALTLTGAMIAEATVYGSLVNRLRVEAWWADHPELVDETIESPIIVVGMSRSGTTALSHLLGMDRGLRSLRRWEAVESIPPPDADSYWTDPRYRAAVEVDSHLNGITSGNADPVQIGALTVDFMSRCADGLVADAEKFGDDGMIHVSYPEFVANPLQVVEDVYRRLDRDLTGETRQAMCALIADRPQHKHGVHGYDMGDFGLKRAELDDLFAGYRERFGVDAERPRAPGR